MWEDPKGAIIVNLGIVFIVASIIYFGRSAIEFDGAFTSWVILIIGIGTFLVWPLCNIGFYVYHAFLEAPIGDIEEAKRSWVFCGVARRHEKIFFANLQAQLAYEKRFEDYKRDPFNSPLQVQLCNNHEQNK